MPPDRELTNAIPGQPPIHLDVQQIIEAIRGQGKQGVKRAWQASDSAKVVLTSTAAGVQISRDNGTTAPTHVVNDGTAAGGQLAGTYPNPSLSVATIDALLPPGTIWAHAGSAVPLGWLLCNGASLATSLYPKLFAAIGYAYGGGPTGPFSLPDLRGRVLLGASGLHARGTVGGAESQTVAGLSHTHPQTHSHVSGAHTHGQNAHTHTVGAHTHDPGLHTHGQNAHTHDLTGTHSHGPGAHSHTLGGHSHALTGHTHAAGGHSHDISGHTHLVNLDHDHGTAAGAAGASATTLNGRFTAGGANALPDAHTHPVDIPALGLINTTSGTSSAPSTAGPSPGGDTGTVVGTPSTGGPSGGSDGPSANDTATVSGTPSTGGPSNPNTQGPSATTTGGIASGTPDTGGPSNPNTQGATASTTGDDSTAAAATYGGSSTVPTMMPFQVVGQYIIWPGA